MSCSKQNKFYLVTSDEILYLIKNDTEKSLELLTYCNEEFGCGNWKFRSSEIRNAFGYRYRNLEGIEFRYKEDAFLFRLAWC